MIFSLFETILLFFIYSFWGWCVEVAFVAVTVGKIQNRGFLNGPVCPIYGCGMLGVLVALSSLKDQWLLLFFGGMLICTAVELFGGWVLDKIFHMRWWDYSNKPFNIGGYVCLGFSIMWGLAVVLVVKFIHPPIFAVVSKMPKLIGWIAIGILIAVFIADMIVTLKNLIGIKKSLGQLEILASDLNNIGNQLKDVVGISAVAVAERAEDTIEGIGQRTEANKEKLAEQFKELNDRWNRAVDKIQKNRKHILNSLPKLNKLGKSINIKEYINSLKIFDEKTDDK